MTKCVRVFYCLTSLAAWAITDGCQLGFPHTRSGRIDFFKSKDDNVDNSHFKSSLVTGNPENTDDILRVVFAASH